MELSHGWEHPGWFSSPGTNPEYKPSFERFIISDLDVTLLSNL